LTGIFADQAFVAGGSAVIIMTAPKVEAARDTARNFFAGFLGQFFYLAAALEGISICCVGGFDYARLATAFRVADDRFPVYAMVLGRAGPDQLKVDRRRLPAERGLAPHMSTKPKGEHHAVL